MIENKKEIFKQHSSGARVSNFGRVKGILVEFLKPCLQSTGYYSVYIKGKFRKIHTLVAETFIGPISSGFCVNHKDFNKTNNFVDNLEIISIKDNISHWYNSEEAQKRVPKGENHYKSSLTNKDVILIYYLIKEGYTTKEICEKFGISSPVFYKIRKGTNRKFLYSKYFENDKNLLVQKSD